MKALNLRQLVEMVNEGVAPVVQFTKEISELEGYFDQHMRAKVISAYQNVSEDSFTVVFDVNGFNDYNLKFEVANYYGVKEGDPRITATQAGFNPLTRKGGNGSESYYFAANDPTVYFTLIDQGDDGLFSEFSERADSSESYIQWLEKQLIAARIEVQNLYEDQAGADI
jgi:hypothetical protein